MHAGSGPPLPTLKALLSDVARARAGGSKIFQDASLTEAYRQVLRGYRSLRLAGAEPGPEWREPVDEALQFLGADSDRLAEPLADYDADRFGPFLGISNEGDDAELIMKVAAVTPKAVALGGSRSPMSLGLAVDAERLSSVGEVPAGAADFAQIWRACAARGLMTANIGSRANIRLYRHPPVVAVDPDKVDEAKAALTATFKPFLEAPGGPRPLIVFLCFPGDPHPEVLRALADHVRNGGIAAGDIHQLGLAVTVNAGQGGEERIVAAIDVAADAGIGFVAVDGAVLPEADRNISLPGLLNYFEPEQLDRLLRHATSKHVRLRPVKDVDADAVAHQAWSALNTARAIGLNLGKYGLLPLTVEESERVVEHVQSRLGDWSAAPVLYVEQPLLTAERVYHKAHLEEGVAAWLRMVARHGVRLVLIDTADKSKGWKLLKRDGDPKGLLTSEQIRSLDDLGRGLGVQIMWAGGITAEQVPVFGGLEVFGIYVTSAVSDAAPVTGLYLRDPALASTKRPNFDKMLAVKTLLEASFLAAKLSRGGPAERAAAERIAAAGSDVAALARLLPESWRLSWKQPPGEHSDGRPGPLFRR